MTNEQIEHMLPGPQWAAYRARLEQEILTARQLAKRLHGHPATIKAHVHNLKRQFSMEITANE